MKGPIIDIGQILGDPGIKRRIAAPIHLPEARYPWLDAKSALQPGLLKSLYIPQWEWPRTHQTHVTLNNVEKLRQFVEARSAQDAPDGRNPWIILNFKHWALRFV